MPEPRSGPPLGGQPPLDPKSDEAAFQTPATERFKQDAASQALLAATHKLVDVFEQGRLIAGSIRRPWPLVDLAGNSLVV